MNVSTDVVRQALTIAVGSFVVIWAAERVVLGDDAAPTVDVAVDCADIVGPRAHPENYLNTSIVHAPPLALADLMVKEYGKPKIVRCWLTLHHMWNPRTDAYDFDFKIPRRVYEDKFQPDKPDGTAMAKRAEAYENFNDYLDAFRLNSEEILLNIRDFEREVLAGTIKMEKWKEVFGKAVRHCAERCPNLRYIEVLNESELLGVNIDQYYKFYRAAYEVINQFNDERKLQAPLLVGGPCPCRYEARDLHRFLENYAKDTNPRKRLDFVSFHDYYSGRTPSVYEAFEHRFQKELKRLGLPTNLPVLMTEVGYGGGTGTPNPRRNVEQAAALTTYVYYSRQSPNLRVFPWVLFHCRNQLCYAQFTQDLTMTPFGAAVKAWSLHKNDEIRAFVQRKKDEMGVYAMASLDDSGVAIQVWNYQASADKQPDVRPAATARVAVRNLPEKWKNSKLKVRQYLIDSTHSNCFAENAKGGGHLEQIKCAEVDAKDLDRLVVHLEPNAICLWLMEL